ncbi:MAG TPA: pirin-like C-terminal cupin domain-containing protein [Cyclobacteriaceae bacterium]|nr:pirin-like C-terminal cupin domain-containing protein [Cyclobacteriaceae bacterium]
MAIKRKLVNIQAPPAQQGFLGAGHTAFPVIQVDFTDSDPFVMLMDDRLDKKDDVPVGGPHPHAGFETVTLILEGELGDTAHTMRSGDLQMMTAGGGIVHTETIDKPMKMRILQLWLNLPKKDRWTLPRVQDIQSSHVPSVTKDGVTIKVYSGSLAGATSPLQNYAPIIIADIELKPGATTVQQLPSSYSTFLYGIEGSVNVGDDNKVLKHDQVGWLDRFHEQEPSELQITGGASGGRIILYSGQPQGDEIVVHGPFIGDNEDDIRRLYRDFRQGKMGHINDVPAPQKMMW